VFDIDEMQEAGEGYFELKAVREAQVTNGYFLLVVTLARQYKTLKSSSLKVLLRPHGQVIMLKLFFQDILLVTLIKLHMVTSST